MASPEVPRSAPPEPDWTDQVTDLVVDLVDSVRERTTGNIVKVARALIFGTVAVIVLFVVAIVGLIFAGRLIAQLPIDEWISYLILGMLLTLAGFILWSKRFGTEVKSQQ